MCGGGGHVPVVSKSQEILVVLFLLLLLTSPGHRPIPIRRFVSGCGGMLGWMRRRGRGWVGIVAVAVVVDDRCGTSSCWWHHDSGRIIISMVVVISCSNGLLHVCLHSSLLCMYHPCFRYHLVEMR